MSKINSMMFINPKAGALKGLTEPAEIKARLSQFGLAPELYIGKTGRGMSSFIKKVKAVKPRAVLIAGGDGTIGTIIKGLVGQPLTFGLVPTGSINNVGGSIGIPAEIDGALKVIASGRTGRFDVGQAGPNYFLEAAGIGLVANIFDQTDWDKDKKIVQMAHKTVQQVVSPDLISVRAIVDGQKLDFETVWLTVANNCKLGAFTLDPKSSLGDGWLDLIYCRPLELLELPKYAASFLKGNHLAEDKFESIKGKQIDLYLPPQTTIHIDDRIFKRSRLKFKVVPGAIKVFIP